MRKENQASLNRLIESYGGNFRLKLENIEGFNIR
jgi:hypothetical protein